ncbi:unnamed protein product, partial [Linum tenue]
MLLNLRHQRVPVGTQNPVHDLAFLEEEKGWHGFHIKLHSNTLSKHRENH